MRPRIGRIDRVMCVLPRPVFADQRLPQTMGVMHIVEAKAALHAQPVLIGGAVSAADIKELVVLDMIAELAPDAAIGANAVHLAIRKGGPHIGFVDKARGPQRAGRARLYAFAAGAAGRSTHR